MVFIDRHYLPKLNQDEMNYLHSPINPKEIEVSLKVSQQKKKKKKLRAKWF
jgi:hypothetical protein